MEENSEPTKEEGVKALPEVIPGGEENGPVALQNPDGSFSTPQNRLDEYRTTPPEDSEAPSLRAYKANLKKAVDRATQRRKVTSGAPRLTPAQRKEMRKAQLAKAHAALKVKKASRDAVRAKVARGEPLSREEHEMIYWTAARTKEQAKRMALDAVAKLVIKPKTIQELRLVVENTAARHAYNPIEELIKMSQELGSDLESRQEMIRAYSDPGSEIYEPETAAILREGIPDLIKDKISIDSKLLPFLVPAISAPKAEHAEDPDKRRVRVSVNRFVMPNEAGAQPLYKDKMVVVDLDPAQDADMPEIPRVSPDDEPVTVQPEANV